MSSPNTEDRALNTVELEMVNETRPPAVEQKTKEEAAVVHYWRRGDTNTGAAAGRYEDYLI